MKFSYPTLTDQFCGCGGSATGAKKAGADVKVAMNHWKRACDTYEANINVKPDCRDVSATDPRRYVSTDMFISSPECTNHSLAKGKKRLLYDADLWGNKLSDPADERSRATMWDVPRFAEYHNYNIIIVENVVDAAKWRLWDSWLQAMKSLGYDHEVVYMNSMFAHPTPQSRDRLYVVFWKHGNKKPNLEFRPTAYCTSCEKNVESIQTWKKPVHWGRYNRQYFYRCPDCHQEVKPYYYAAFNALDFTIPAVRIGDRPVPLKPKTMVRVRYGWETYGRRPMIITGRYTTGIESRVKDAMAEPIPTQPGDASHAVLFPWMVDVAHSQGNGPYSYDVLGPHPTATTQQSVGVVMPWLVKTVRQENGDRPISSVDPSWTQTSCQDMGIVAPAFIAELHGTSKASGIEDPMMCMVAGAKHHALISADAFLTYYYGNSKAKGITDPLGTVTSVDHVGLVQKLDGMSVEDLTFRMIRSHEVGRAMAFPDEYIVLGTERERVKQYGNAVTPPVMEMLVSRCMETLR